MSCKGGSKRADWTGKISEPHPNGLLFKFTLPKGAYATTVLREFMKTEVALPEEEMQGQSAQEVLL